MVSTTLSSWAFIESPASSIICDGYAVDNIVDEFGTTVVLRVVSKTFPDEYGDATETYVDTRTKAMVQTYTARDQEVREGQFKAGEIIFTLLKQDESKVVPGNRILYAGTWYGIREVVKQPLVDTLYYLTARVQKI